MDILMILMASLGIGYLTIGTGSIAKDALSKMSDEARRDPVDTSKLKSFLIAIAYMVYIEKKENSKVKRLWLLTNNINANNAVIP